MLRLPPFDKIGTLPVPDCVNADPLNGQPGSILNMLMFNILQHEGENAALLAGLAPSGTDLTQWAQAISRGGIWAGLLTGTGDLAVATLGVVVPDLLQGMRIGAVATAANTVTNPKLRVVNKGSQGGFLDYPILKQDGSALAVGDIKAGRCYRYEMDGAGNALISGGGISAGAGGSGSAPLGRPVGLKIATTSNTVMTLSADELVLGSSSGATQRLTGVSATITTTVQGVGGVDTGTIANSTAYDLYAAYNPTTSTFGAFATVEGNNPTLPSGFTFYRRLGWGKTDSAGRWLWILQTGDEWHYVVQPAGSANTTGLPVVASGAVGNAGQSNVFSYVGIPLAGLAPAKSVRADFTMQALGTNGYNMTIMAPNPNYAVPAASMSASSTMFASSQNNTIAVADCLQASIPLEGAIVYMSQQQNAATVISGGKIII